MKCIDDEIPFEIPEGWEWARINAIGISQLGKTLDRGKDLGKEYPYLCSINVYWDGIDLAKIKTFRLRDDELARYKLQKGDLLICEGGDYGRCCIWNRDEDMYYQNALHRVRFYGGLMSSFYKYVFELYRNIGYVVGQGQTIKHFTYESMKSILFPVPSISEQKRIVSRIEEIQPIVKKYGRTEETLKRLNAEIFDKLKKSVLQEAIQGKLVPQDPNDEPASVLLERIREEKQRLLKEGKLKKKDITDSVIFKGEDNKYFEKIGNDILCLEDEMLFDIPDKWMWTRLSTIANLYTGNSISETDKKQKYTNVYGLEYIGTKDVGFDHLINYSNGVAIPLQHIENFKIAPSHSVLLCIEGGSAGRKIARLQKDVCFGNKLCCLSPYFVSLSEYIYYYLQSPAFFESFQGNIAGIIGGVSVNTLKSLLIPLPPIEEIKRITIRLQEVLSSIMSR